MSERFDAVDIILTKRDKGTLSDAQIDWVVDAYTRGVVAEKQDESSGTLAGVQGSPRPVGAVSPPPPSYPVAGTAAAGGASLSWAFRRAR